MPDFSAMPEVFVSNADLAAAVSRETKHGRLRKLGSRLYTRNLTEPPERIVQRNLWPLVAAYLPGALIADRTALENRPAAGGSVFVIADHKRDIALPGVILRPRKGPPPLESDRTFIGSLRIASPARAFLENMRPSRRRSTDGSLERAHTEIFGRLHPRSLEKSRGGRGSQTGTDGRTRETRGTAGWSIPRSGARLHSCAGCGASRSPSPRRHTPRGT